MADSSSAPARQVTPEGEAPSASASSDSPRTWIANAKARNGAQLCIRTLRPDDREREVAFINSLSETSRYFRLLTPLKFLSPHLLNQLMDVDGDRRMAFVATVNAPDGEQFVGIARYAVADDATTAEIGISVTDSWQRQGIAQLLIAQLCRYARARGFMRMTGIVLPENQCMLALARRTGFATCFKRRGPSDAHRARSLRPTGRPAEPCAGIVAGAIHQIVVVTP